MGKTNRVLEFTDEEMARIGKVREALGITYIELIHDATMSAVEQLEATTEAARRAGVFG
jgi:2-hydroxychromene-2-carboxylate isomerase